MCDIVRRSADDAQQLAERRGCRIEFRLPVQACMAEVDRRRVERILRNLLVNAVEHGEGRDVVVSVAEDRDTVAVAVRDHGVGLAPGEEQLVFERFWRADPARARTTGGTGLGLAIALEDARLHGGWLQAWGEKGRGSVFRLTLPRTAGQPLAGSPLPLGPDEADVITSAVTTLDADLAAVAGRRPRLPAGLADEEDKQVAPAGARPRWPRSLVAALSATAGCVSMPTGGPVRSYPVTQGPDAQSHPYVQIQPQPPGAGWSPKQIVQGFLTASASFGNYSQVALQYLTPQCRRSGTRLVGGGLQEGPERRRPDLPVRAKTRRKPRTQDRDGDRGSPAPSRRRSGKRQLLGAVGLVHRQRFVRRAADVRAVQGRRPVADLGAPSELLLTSDSFANDYQLRNLYFFDPTEQYLVPDPSTCRCGRRAT